MSTTYPGAIQTFSDPAGTSPLISPDHAGLHTDMNDTVEAIQNTLGTTGGTSVLKNFVAGNFPARINSSNVLQQVISGTVNLAAGTITGQIANSGTIANGVYGTATYVGGTSTNQVINNGTLGTPAITGGTGNAMTLGTPTIGTVTVPGTTLPLSFSAAIAPGVGTIADAGTMTINAQQAQVFFSVLGTSAGNRLIANPLNMVSGQFFNLAVQASGSANGTLTFGTIFRFAAGGTPVLGTASTWNYMGFRKNPVDGRVDYQGASLSLI